MDIYRDPGAQPDRDGFVCGEDPIADRDGSRTILTTDLRGYTRIEVRAGLQTLRLRYLGHRFTRNPRRSKPALNLRLDIVIIPLMPTGIATPAWLRTGICVV